MSGRKSMPTRDGFFGAYGGKFVPETLMAPLAELEAGYRAAKRDRAFRQELDDLLRDYVGRPTPLTEAPRFAAACGDFRLFLKREDLNHTGAHKINNALGQALLAKRMGKTRIIAETGAGQHGVATATACALLGLRCRVYMGEVDIARQAPNVHRMRLLGAEVTAVTSGSRTLKDAINEAIRDWVTNVADTHYIIGSVLGPHPYPVMVRDFQSVIGREAAAQIRRRAGKLPDIAIACVGGGSNSIGLFHELLKHGGVRLIGVEAGGRGLGPGDHAARFAGGSPGVLHGTRSLLLQDEEGQIGETHSISAGLDYPSVGPELAYLGGEGRIEITSCGDDAALAAFHRLSATEGIIPALESAHALGYLLEHGREIPAGSVVVVNLSGRGDKDVPQVVAMAGLARSEQVVIPSVARDLGGGAVRRSKFSAPPNHPDPSLTLGMTSARPAHKRRIASAFAAMKRDGRCGLVAYLTCGETGVDGTIEIALALAAAGADVLELGIPFSDPIADGPVIQAAAQRALDRGTTLDDVMAIAEGIRRSSEIPLVAFSYLNPILKYGEERFARRARAAGFDGVLVTDLPPEAGGAFCGALRASDLDPVFLVAPTSTPERIRLADRMSRGFLYCVSTSGVTGARRALDPALLGRLDALRPAVKNPVAVGFGVASREQYRELSARCDAVVVGSAIVRAIGEGEEDGAAERAAGVVRGILGVGAHVVTTTA